MWNRDEGKDDETMDTTEVRPDTASTSGRGSAAPGDRRAIIGESITIQGEVTGNEDLTIQGHVDGSVTLDENAVTVGPAGKVEADIVARVIAVEGHVEGDLEADDQVVLRGSARVEGDISAPRVVLEDGSYFRGAVDMEDSSEGGDRGAGSTSRQQAGRSSSYGTASSGTTVGSADEGTEEGESGDEDEP